MKKRWLSALLALLLIVQAAPAFAGGFSEDPAAVDRAAKSVLMLEVYDSDGYAFARGSGFVAFDSGTLITNYHVVEDGAWMIAYSDDGYEYNVTKILVADADKDIAVCAFESPTDMPPLALNADGDLLRAETCVAIGSPKGIRNLVSIGNISARYEEWGVDWIQFTAPVSNGSSGGALFDNYGRVIGVTSAIYNDEMAQNINYAVHIGEVVRLYESWDGVVRPLSDYEDAIPDGDVSPEPDDNTPEPEPAPEPDLPVSGASYETLRRGDFKVAVINLQKALSVLGYYDGKTDGLFNEATEAAVAAFNLANFGTDSGVADEEMQRLLFEGDPIPYGAQPEPDADSAEYIELRRGDFKAAVVNLQKALAALGYYDGEANGLFNEATEAAVAAFNLANFGTDSGVADEEMQRLLFEGEPLPYGAQPEPDAADGADYTELKRGDFSAAVVKMQKALAVLGYYSGEADGVFDADTEQAVLSFNQTCLGTDSTVASAEMQKKLFDMALGLPETAGGVHFAASCPVYAVNSETNTLDVTFSIVNGSGQTVSECLVYVYASGDDGVNLYTPNVYSYTEQTPIAPGETLETVLFQLEKPDQITTLFAGLCSITYADGTVVTYDPLEIEYSAWCIG